MSARTKKRVAVVSASVMALALAGGVAAQFSASTTSVPQRIGTGTLSIDFQNESAGWTQDVTNLAAGDSEVVTVDFVNTGSLSLSDDVTLAVADTTTGGLTADLNGAQTRDDSLRVKIASTFGTAYDGPVTALFGAGQKIPSGLLGLGAGDRTVLTFTYTVPATAGNVYQAKGAHLVYTAKANQRAGNSGASISQPAAASGFAQITDPHLLSTPVTDSRGNVYLMGGQYNGEYLSSGLKHDAATGAWSTFNTPTVRGYASFASDGRYLYRTGGTDASGNNTADFSRYDTTTGTWSNLANTTSVTAGAASVVSKGSVYVVGGQEFTLTMPQYGAGDTNDGNNLRRYNIASGTWTNLAELPFDTSGGTAATDADGNIYYFGGTRENYAPTNGQNLSVLKYNPSTNTWVQLAGQAASGHYFGAALADDGKFYLASGMDYSTNSSDASTSVDVYDVRTQTWSTLAQQVDFQMGSVLLKGADGKIYIGGGVNDTEDVNTFTAIN